MAKSIKKMREEKKLELVNGIIEYLEKTEDVGFEKANKINFPIVLEDGTEDWCVITVSIPTGANKGTEPYDGYAMREDFELHEKEKIEKKKKAEEQKAKKIERDKAYREKKEKQKEIHE